jgi:hypothetical protein
MVEMKYVSVMMIHFGWINKVNWVLLELMVEEEMERKNDFVKHWNKIVNYKNDLLKNLVEDLKTLM